MAILDIIKYGDPLLRKVAEPYTDGELSKEFVDDMIETIKERDGVGLATSWRVQTFYRSIRFEGSLCVDQS